MASPLSTNLPATRSRRAIASTTLAAATVVATLLAGCASSGPDEAVGHNTSASTPMVISGSPQSDTAAFRTASRKEASARYDVQEDIAPKPKWESSLNPRGRRLDAAERDAFGPMAEPEAVTEAPPEAPNEAGGLVGPLAANDLPSDAYTTAIPGSDPAPLDIATMSTAELIGNLPLSRTELPDGRIRLIWHLRSYGGPSVKADGGTGNTRRNVTLTPTDLAPLVGLVQAQLADKGTVLPLATESKMVITCTPEVERGVLRLLHEIDVPAPQVEIAATIFEVSHDFDYQQGARLLLNRIAADGTASGLSSFRTEELLESLAGAPFQGSIVSLMQVFEEAGMSLDAQFELLAEAGMVNVVSKPRLTVSEGRTGYMLAGQELPIQSANIVNNAINTSTQYKPVGVQLYITPQAIGDGMVKLHTVSIVSSVAGFTPLPAMSGGAKSNTMMVNPIIESREAETTVTVPTGDTLVISGMRMVRTTTKEEKIPGLGDLPIIGNFFKSHRSQQKMTDLYFFVTPTLASAMD